MILAFPYMFFALDSGFRAIDVHTLTEASQSLGAGWPTTMFKVILPNIRVAALAGSFLAFAIVLGEFTIANLVAVLHVPDLPELRERDAVVPGRRRGAGQLRDHLGRDAQPALHRAGSHRPSVTCGRWTLMAYLELQNLQRRFGTFTALDGIEVQLGQGEFLSLLGPSGCGKTTALRLVAGFDRPDGGAIVVDGKDVTRVPPSKRDMGMVFQAYSLFPNMTAAQNVEFGLKIRGGDSAKRRERVHELLELVGLGHAVDRYPHQLSGGMQQRVALARALAIEPRVLLLDEPLSALDAKVRVQLREEIRRIQLELGITTLYVTHDQEEALAISDRVAVMYERPDRADGHAGRDVRLARDAVRRGVHRDDEPARLARSSTARPARCSTATRRSTSTPRAAARKAIASSCWSGPRSCSSRRHRTAAARRQRAERHGAVSDVPRRGDARQGDDADRDADLRHVGRRGPKRCRSVRRVTARVPSDETRLISLPDEGVTFSAQDLESH